MKQDMIVILDLGSHENTVLARAIRALGVYSEIYPHDITVEELKALPNVKGIIINGGPNNVIDGVAIDVNPGIYSIGIPVMAAGHDKALCEVKLNEFSSDMEAIKESVKTFVFDTCKAEANWNMTNFVNDQIELVRRQVGDRKVLLALSGGVDSSVVAALLLKAIGDKLVCVHVNHGLMRKGESENVVEVFKNQLNANLIYKDVTDRFLDKLAGVADPEEKRKIIGGEFIRVFEEEARKLDGIDFLAQGTIYPDIVESGTKTLKDAVNACMQEWTARVDDTLYVLGSVMGPHPFPTIVRDFQSVISKESRAQILEKEGRLPDVVMACVGGGSNAMGSFYEYINDKDVKLIGCEAAGHGVDTDKTAATMAVGSEGVFHGMKSYFCQNEYGQIAPVYSISAGLDYPGVGPEHAYLKDIGRAEYVPVTDEEAVEAFEYIAKEEGIIAAIESSHAVAHLLKIAPKMRKEQIIICTLSGRGDKDVAAIARYRGIDLHE